MVKCLQCAELDPKHVAASFKIRSQIVANEYVCPDCGYQFPLPALTVHERISSLVDPDTFITVSRKITSVDSLGFLDTLPYAARIKIAHHKTGSTHETTVGTACIKQIPIVLAIMDFEFIGGSMGSVVGEQIAHGIRVATQKKHPFILFSSTGGARMQEGILSLMQMAKITFARSLLAKSQTPFISVMTHPTMAGVQASIASLGDIIIAEQGAVIGFTGRRVIEETIRQKLPAAFQTPPFALEKGQIDNIVFRKHMREHIEQLLTFFQSKPS